MVGVFVGVMVGVSVGVAVGSGVSVGVAVGSGVDVAVGVGVTSQLYINVPEVISKSSRSSARPVSSRGDISPNEQSGQVTSNVRETRDPMLPAGTESLTVNAPTMTSPATGSLQSNRIHPPIGGTRSPSAQLT